MKYIGKHLRKNRKFKKRIINFITTVMFLLFWFSIGSLDSESLVPLFTMVISLGWVSLYVLVNGEKIR